MTLLDRGMMCRFLRSFSLLRLVRACSGDFLILHIKPFEDLSVDQEQKQQNRCSLQLSQTLRRRGVLFFTKGHAGLDKFSLFTHLKQFYL